MKSSTKTLFFVLAALFLFAIGFIGINLYQTAQFDDARSQPVPSLPVAQ